jgi:hypothetical protein
VAIRAEERYYRQILDALARAGFTDVDDPVGAQLTVSRLFGTVWSAQPSPRDGSMEEGFGLGLVRAARRRPTPSALALLRTVAVVAPIREVREAARADIAAYRAGGSHHEPGTELTHRRTRTREEAHRPQPARPLDADRAPTGHPRSWFYGDVFGDRTVVLCESGDHRGVAVHIDHLYAGSAVDAEELANVEDTVQRLRTTGMRSANALDDTHPYQRHAWSMLRQVEPGWAAMVIRRSVARTDLVGDVPVSTEYSQLRALVLARLAELPEPTEEQLHDHGGVRGNAGTPEAMWLANPVVDFLHDHPGLPDPTYAAAVANLVLAFGQEHDPDDVTRVSPRLWHDFLTHWWPSRGLATPDRPGSDPRLAPVLRAWSAWVARRRSLPGPARDHLARALDATLAAGNAPTNPGTRVAGAAVRRPGR